MQLRPPKFRGWPAGLIIFAALCAAAPPSRAAQSLIAFALDTDDQGRASRIYVAAPDGSGLRQLSSGAGRDRAPAFSPDGKQIAYQTTNALGLDTLLVQPLEESRPPRVLATGAHPQWSADGHFILFARRQLNDYQLFSIRADGTQKENTLKPLVRGQIGRWSPDEKRLAVVAPVIVDGRDRWQLQIMPTDTLTANLRITLPEDYGQVVALDWSPVTDSLLLSTTRQSRYTLYVVDLSSPAPRKVPLGDAVPNPAYGCWSADGKDILFRSAADVSTGVGTLSRLCAMKADGSQVRVIWEPENHALRIQGTAWSRPAVSPVKPTPPVVKTDPPKPEPVPVKPEPVKPLPEVPAPVQRVLGPPHKLHGSKLFVVQPQRSPVTVNLAVPREADFVISVPLQPLKKWTPRRQGVGVTLELSDGGLYRGNVIFNGAPWVTVQGRPRGGKVHLIDGKQLPAGGASFSGGFKLTLRREGGNLVVAVNDQDLITRPVLTSAVKNLALTLENFDPGSAQFNLGAIYYREWLPGTAPAPATPAGTSTPINPAAVGK